MPTRTGQCNGHGIHWIVPQATVRLRSGAFSPLAGSSSGVTRRAAQPAEKLPSCLLPVGNPAWRFLEARFGPTSDLVTSQEQRNDKGVYRDQHEGITSVLPVIQAHRKSRQPNLSDPGMSIGSIRSRRGGSAIPYSHPVLLIFRLARNELEF